ncbi:MAG TPA: AAA family ATPase, partial [Candidatus Cybelea sp.]
VETAIAALTPTNAERDEKEAGWIFELASEIAARGIPPVEWDVEGLLEHYSGPVIIFGMPESLKSWLALHLACCIATGAMFLGRFIVSKRSEVVYVNFDAGGREFNRRVALVGTGIPNLHVTSPPSFELDELRKVFERYPGGFIILDCFADVYFADPKVEPGQSMREWVRGIRKLYETFGCNGAIIDHSRRPRSGDPGTTERYYGNVQKKAAIRQMWFIERLRQAADDPKVVRAKVVCEKQAEAEKFAPFIAEVRWTPTTAEFAFVGPLDEIAARADAAMRHREIIDPYLADAPNGLTVAQLAAKTNLSAYQVRSALNTPGIVARGKARATRYVLSTACVSLTDGDDGRSSSPPKKQPAPSIQP